MTTAKAPERATYDHLPAEQRDAANTLRALLPPGTTVYTVLRHVSRSGMQRRYDLYVIRDDKPRYLTGYVAKVLGWRRKDGDLVVNGCGMDMAYHCVYTLSDALHGDGYALTQQAL